MKSRVYGPRWIFEDIDGPLVLLLASAPVSRRPSRWFTHCASDGVRFSCVPGREKLATMKWLSASVNTKTLVLLTLLGLELVS